MSKSKGFDRQSRMRTAPHLGPFAGNHEKFEKVAGNECHPSPHQCGMIFHFAEIHLCKEKIKNVSTRHSTAVWVITPPVVPLWPAGPRAFQGLSSTVKLYFVLHHLPYRVKLRIRVGYRANPLKKKHNKNSCFKKPNLRKFEYTILNDFKTDMKPGAQN